MSTGFPAPPSFAGAWTCPFCPLACDHLRVDVGAASLSLQGGVCARASLALAQHANQTVPGLAELDGQHCAPPKAITAAARLLTSSRQPLFAGLGTDVSGARALYSLANATGAICDAAGGAALMPGLRALQDRGQFTTTLAEVRTRADVIVFIGGLPTGLAPLVRERFGLGEAGQLARHVVVLGPEPQDAAQLAAWTGAGVSVESIALQGDLFSTLSILLALLADRTVPAASQALGSLAQRLRAARYGVLVGAPQRLPAQAALIIEAVHHAVGELNRNTRAAALWIGGGNGAATVNQVFTWLSGLPLRSRAGPHGLEHEPLCFDTQRLLADKAVDALLWVASFDAELAPPPNQLPMIVLGPPALAVACRRPGTVFIAVSTPGIGCDGDVFRTDGTVLMPLHAVRRDALPSVADVAKGLLLALNEMRAA